ncbi:MAG: hypothetical protein M0Q49_03250 [Porticoccaceae bacterium]|nr:hypothetical protein [Porticoccaceae bacterium]
MAVYRNVAPGVKKNVGTSAEEITQGSVNKNNTYRMRVVNKTASAQTCTLWTAASSWTTGDPAGTDDVVVFPAAFIDPNSFVDVIVWLAGNRKVIAKAGGANSIDLSWGGVEEDNT